MAMIPENVLGWMETLGRSQFDALSEGETRDLIEMLNSAPMRAAFSKAIQNVAEVELELRSLNVMLPEQQAQALRVQGRVQGLIAFFETLWEIADARTS